MIQTIIFDLSEVLIAGLVGIEKKLSTRLNIPEERVLPGLNTPLLQDLFCGRALEEQFLADVLQRQGWELSLPELQQTIRQNFHSRVPGMEELLARLARDFELVLLSDHAREWADYILGVHPFLQTFKARFFSFELGQTKRDPSTFRIVLQRIERSPQECVFVDDSEGNIVSAQSTGLTAIRFHSASALASCLQDIGLGNTSAFAPAG